MKILYVANVRLPTEKAHGIQIMEMCQAFGLLGNEVLLLAPKRKNSIKQDPYDYYEITRNFTLKKVPIIDLVSWGLFGYVVEWLTFAISATYFTLFKTYDVVYGRDELTLLLFKLLGKKVVWEGHTGQWNLCVRGLSFLKVPFVVISSGLERFYLSKGVSGERLLVAHDGVNLKNYEGPVTRESIRKSYGISDHDYLVLYTGKLSGWKGVPLLLEASLDERVSSYQFVLVGGTPEEISRIQETHPKVLVLPHLSRKSVADLQRVSDVVVIPNTAKHIVSNEYTSPLKLFEYMVSLVPMVVSNIPSLRDVVTSEEVFFFEGDNKDSLVEALVACRSNPTLAESKAKKAWELAQGYTWSARAKKILSFIYG